MMQFRRSMVLASFAALTFAACQGDTPLPSATTSVTSVKVEAPAQATTTDKDLVGETQSDEPTQAAVVPAPSKRVSTTKQSARSFVAAPAPAAAPASVLFDNRLPGDYRLERVRMSVDGVLSYDAPSVGAMRLPPGDHLIEVIADYRLHDPVFSYVDGYRVELRTTGVVPASNSSSSFVAVAVPSGGVTTPDEKRATLAWHRAP